MFLFRFSIFFLKYFPKILNFMNSIFNLYFQYRRWSSSLHCVWQYIMYILYIIKLGIYAVFLWIKTSKAHIKIIQTHVPIVKEFIEKFIYPKKKGTQYIKYIDYPQFSHLILQPIFSNCCLFKHFYPFYTLFL